MMVMLDYGIMEIENSSIIENSLLKIHSLYVFNGYHFLKEIVEE